MARRGGRRPFMGAMKHASGRLSSQVYEQDGLTVKNRAKYGAPEMPEDFALKTPVARDLKKIWTEYIVPCDWLIKADTPVCIMFCQLWRQLQEAIKSGKKVKLALYAATRMTALELGLSPLARVHMRRATLPLNGAAGEKKKRYRPYKGKRKSREERERERAEKAAKEGEDRSTAEVEVREIEVTGFDKYA